MSGSRLGVIFQSTFAIVLGVCVAVAGNWKLGLAGSAFIPAILIASRWQMKIMVNNARVTLPYLKLSKFVNKSFYEAIVMDWQLLFFATV